MQLRRINLLRDILLLVPVLFFLVRILFVFDCLFVESFPLRCPPRQKRRSALYLQSTLDAGSNNFRSIHSMTTTTTNEHGATASDDLKLSQVVTTLKSELYLSKQSTAARVFQNSPELINYYWRSIASKNGDDAGGVRDTPVSLFRAKVGIGREKLRSIAIRHPDLLAHLLVNSHNVTTTKDLLQQELTLTSKDVIKIEKEAPNVIRRLYRNDLRSKLKFLKTELGLDQPTLKKVVLKRPKLLAYSVEKFTTMHIFFSVELRMEKSDIAKMIRKMPMILSYSVDNNLRPTIDFLLNEIGCTEDQTKKICCRYPQVLVSPVTKLTSKASFLYETLKLVSLEDLSRIATLFTPLLWLSESNIRSKIDLLVQELNLNSDELRVVVVTMPHLLALSSENNLKPKIKYFLQDEERGECSTSTLFVDNSWKGAGLSREELKEFVLYQPALLSYSLDKRIIPRVDQMRELGISLSFAPPYVLSMTDAYFDQWLSSHSSSWTISP